MKNRVISYISPYTRSQVHASVECAVVLVCVTASPQALTHLSLMGEHEARLNWTLAGSVTNYPQEEAMLQSLLFQMQYILTDTHLWDVKSDYWYWNTSVCWLTRTGPLPPLFHSHPALTKDGLYSFFHLFVKYREKPIILLAFLMQDNDNVNEMQI